MCSYSFIADHFTDKFKQPPFYLDPQGVLMSPPTRQEFDALRAEVEDMKKLLKRALKYDEETGQPDCGLADKVALLRRIAELVGVDLADAVPRPST